MRWGQHFLVDTDVAERQVAYADLSSDDVVLEIGPGNGVLTTRMASQVKKVIAIEIDAHLAHALPVIPNVEVINADVLQVDLQPLSFTKVVANIPYEISSPLTFTLLKQNFEVGVVMYQKEFAQRLVAQPGTQAYARLSVMAQYYADWEVLETVPATAFRPPPKVASCLVRIQPRDPVFHVDDERTFERVVRILFSHRRKTIKNALRAEHALPEEIAAYLPYGDRRIGKLAPAQIGEISDLLARWEGAA
jgi:16S rRNA (adenine1518-N6/adenine1519-N6)-dimethyltransferase